MAGIRTMLCFRNCLANRMIANCCIYNVLPLSTSYKESRLSNLSYYPKNSRMASGLQRDSALKMLKDKFMNLTTLKKIKHSAPHLYEKCADDVDYITLIKSFNLPDTFQSWFFLIQLHMWMCMTRMGSEEHARALINRMTEAMWEDVQTRMTKLGHLSLKEKKKTLIFLNEQYQAAIVTYDEGFHGSDTVLAASVWRTLYCSKCDDPRLLELVVFYIRRQVSHLDSQDTETVLFDGKLEFLPLNHILDEFNRNKSPT